MEETIYVLQGALKLKSQKWSEVQWTDYYAVKDPIKELAKILDWIEERRSGKTVFYYRLRRIQLYEN